MRGGRRDLRPDLDRGGAMSAHSGLFEGGNAHGGTLRVKTVMGRDVQVPPTRGKANIGNVKENNRRVPAAALKLRFCFKKK